MSVRYLLHVGGVLFLGLVLFACGVSPETETPTSTPDLVATEVAVKQAAAATLTAQAVLAQPPAVAETPAAEETQATETPLPTPSPTAVQTTGDTIQTSPTDTPVPPLCTVVTNGLNMRSGPDVVFEPPLRALPLDTVLIPQARIADNTWIEVQVQETGEVGWVNTGAQFTTCNFDISGLPLGQVPPTPTPLPTATFTPVPPTPTDVPAAPPKRVRVPVEGGREDLKGQIAIPGFSEDELKGPNNNVTFRDRLVFQVEVYDPNKGNHDGAGVESVKIVIYGPNGEVHERTERTAGYCVFGGGEPDCNVFSLKDNNRWPERDKEIQNGNHSVDIIITTKDGREETWIWNFDIEK